MNIVDLNKWMELFAAKVNEHKDYLNDLDREIGDSDHGTNIDRGMSAAMDSLQSKNPETISDAFKLIGMALISKVGGASGPLYGSAFIEMAKKSATSEDLNEILEAGLSGVVNRGKAVIGDKTMVDTWTLVLAQLKEHTLTLDYIDSIKDHTKDIQARKGRASYLGERSIGHIDPGATSSIYLFQAMLEAGINYE